MITWENFSTFIQQLPPGEGKIFVEEPRDPKLPNTWEYLGTLFDSRIKPGMAQYFPWSKIAIGFYPYSGCDIYKDDQSRIVLSYVELGGHRPFRRNFILNQNTPIALEPICISIEIPANEHEAFLSYLHQEFAISPEVIELQLAKFKQVDQLREELDLDQIYIHRRFYNESTKSFNYTIIASKHQVVEISETWRR